MNKLVKWILIGIFICGCLNFNVSDVSGTTDKQGNTLTLTVELSADCKDFVELAGSELYSMAGAEYTVKNSASETVGVFVIDENGKALLKRTDSNELTGLADDVYTVNLTKQPDDAALIGKADMIKYVELKSYTPKPTVITVNTATVLYGKNSSGNYFSNNQYKLWSTTYGTGVFECGIAEVDSPCQIAGFGSHTLDVSDAIILDRNGKTVAGYSNELIYKIMYYGRSGPQQWAGFSNGRYYSPFMSRNGSTQYTGGYSGKDGLAAFITHVALSRAWGKDNGKWKLQAPVSGFYDFWNYVLTAENVPDNFIVYAWQHSQQHSNEQDMFFGYTLAETDYDKQNVTMELEAQFDPINVILTKSGTSSERIAGAQFTVKYYNTVIKDVPSAENIKPMRTWVLKTNERGICWYDDSYRVGGDKLFYHKGSKSNIMIPGTYVVSETLVPKGYAKADDFMIRVTKDVAGGITIVKADGVTPLSYTVEAGYSLTEYKEAYLNLRKTSTNELSKISVKGALYYVYLDADCTLRAKINNAEEYAQLIVGENNLSNTIALAPGKYFIREESSPLGYLIDKKVVEIELNEKETVTIETKDEPILYKIAKVDTAGNPVEKAILELYDDNGLLAEFVTATEPIDISSYLRQGKTYRIHEKETPQGYLTSKDVCFTVEAKKDEFVIIYMIDEYQPSIKTYASFADGRKVNKYGEKEVFDEVIIEKLTQNKKYTVKGYIYNVQNINEKLAEYTETFVAEKEQVELTAEFNFIAEEGNEYVVFEYLFDEQGKLLTSHADINDRAQIISCPKIIHVALIKRDINDQNKILSNCEITIFDNNDEIVQDVYGRQAVKTTDQDGKVEFELFFREDGYYARETKAPNGYRLNNDKFAFKNSNEMITIVINDSPVAETGDVQINVFVLTTFISALFVVILIHKRKKVIKKASS
ncbi:MAG: SpaA isopeptide-forming pilin-related protein [Erysipelotrichia bacterium]|nr:SpaA isopeptide-forming pilin-related protein [Erysipelotrichia bacterium]